MFIKATGFARVTKIREAKTRDGTLVVNVTVVAEMTTGNGTPRTIHAGLSGFDKMAEHMRSLDLKEGDIVSFIGDPRAEVYTPKGSKVPLGYQTVSLQSIQVIDRAPTQAAEPAAAAAPTQASASEPAAPSDAPW